jgi:hypothetical protein
MLKQRVQTTKPKLENHKELPLHTCKLPRRMHANHLNKTEQLHQLSSDRSDRSPSPAKDRLGDQRGWE